MDGKISVKKKSPRNARRDFQKNTEETPFNFLHDEIDGFCTAIHPRAISYSFDTYSVGRVLRIPQRCVSDPVSVSDTRNVRPVSVNSHGNNITKKKKSHRNLLLVLLLL